MTPAGARALLVLSLVLPPVGLPQAAAQEGFRSTDLDRPLRVEDAQPLEHREWELASGIRAGAGEADRVLGGVELAVGLFRNAQAGVELHGGRESRGGDDEAGLEGVGAHLFLSVNRETWARPAFSLRADVETPGSGDLGREGWSVALTGLATRSFDRLRIHANAGYRFADEADGGDLWRTGLAFDYPLALFSRAILGDVYAEIPTRRGSARVWTTVGARWQITNRTVLDVGAGGRVDRWLDGETDAEIVLGVTRSFGIPALTPVPPYPDPRLD